jgi:hypothetical protein
MSNPRENDEITVAEFESQLRCAEAQYKNALRVFANAEQDLKEAKATQACLRRAVRSVGGDWFPRSN